MKKILSVVLALSMVLSMSVTAFAAEDNTSKDVTGEYTPTHQITIEAENGSVTASPTTEKEGKYYAQEGATVTLTVTPNEGYELDGLTVTDGNGSSVNVTENTFTMPTSDVNVKATFTETTADTTPKITGVTLSGDAVDVNDENKTYTITIPENASDANPVVTIHGINLNNIPEREYGYKVLYQPTEDSGVIVMSKYYDAELDAIVYPGVVSAYTQIGETSLKYKNAGDTDYTDTGWKVIVKKASTPDPEPTKYDVNIGSFDGGEVTATPTSAAAGETVTLTVTLNGGYELDVLKIVDANGTNVEYFGSGNTYTFTMPEGNVTVTATFKEQSKVGVTIEWGDMTFSYDDLNEKWDATGKGAYVKISTSDTNTADAIDVSAEFTPADKVGEDELAYNTLGLTADWKDGVHSDTLNDEKTSCTFTLVLSGTPSQKFKGTLGTVTLSIKEAQAETKYATATGDWDDRLTVWSFMGSTSETSGTVTLVGATIKSGAVYTDYYWDKDTWCSSVTATANSSSSLLIKTNTISIDDWTAEINIPAADLTALDGYKIPADGLSITVKIHYESE